MSQLKVIIVGAGMGGLACAIACRRAGVDVTVLEKNDQLTEIGAGVQITPNATQIMRHFGLIDRLLEAGAEPLGITRLIDFKSGRTIGERPGWRWAEKAFGNHWYTIHRADYQRVLADEAVRLGAEMRFGANVVHVECTETPFVRLEGGEKIHADLVVGADGIGSVVRDFVYDGELPFVSRGEVAYRAVIPRSKLEALDDDVYGRLTAGGAMMWIWSGPGTHATAYPVRNDSVFNLVVLGPDDLPEGVSKAKAEREQMELACKDWDTLLRKVVKEASTSVIKWKVVYMDELDTWVKDHVLLLGDSCHPTPPYQAQGSAMAMEDGACLGTLLGLYQKSGNGMALRELLHLYCDIRKDRTALQSRGMKSNAKLFQIKTEDDREEREQMLSQLKWDKNSRSEKWTWGDMVYQTELNAYDTVRDSE
ncbi:ubiquinone biosynthesis monooxygenase COQ6 [Elsinoe australis]|uniref:Ubiquinone biosynthesis monooxygenase COQ6 n=1 Tax=Elsinoe australis TaxID=40998 RepID=A0A2P7ZD67_9PEZI|nr:ubiquinone biosynthesis monooxygenase COQ6 [Elsinoe australis]